ncbi:metal ABC transporter permease [Oryzomicrobium sp.]|uniref:metal ABC transporter permease n=1 Tax=Oryzomicrobium sp. TaxID=1911578 RepID=UPI0025F8DFBB|nr:metal ABC transporter permease [Oryzomicrobium sp.]MCE1243219.1 metal ABC transporter permease [Oryzomicrobium sp.]
MTLQTELLFDPLFLTPFLTGLPYALLLPLLGAYLRLKDEWLAALALAQTAAAGALVVLALAWPPAVGGLLGALVAAAGKHGAEGLAPALRGAAYALLLLFGWGVAVLLVANLPVAERLGHALLDGQLYFTGTAELLTALAVLAVAILGVAFLSRALLTAHFFPDHFRARGRSASRAHLLFDLLVAAALGFATMSVGVMAAFALVFVPPFLAFHRAGSWRRGLVYAMGCGLGGYVAAFALALLLDQPFGAVLSLVLAALALLGVLRASAGRSGA